MFITIRDRQVRALEEMFEVIVGNSKDEVPNIFSKFEMKVAVVDCDPIDPGGDILFVKALRLVFSGVIITTTDGRRSAELIKAGCSMHSSRLHIAEFLHRLLPRL